MKVVSVSSSRRPASVTIHGRRPARVQARGIIFVQANKDFRLSKMAGVPLQYVASEPSPPPTASMVPTVIGAITFISASMVLYKNSSR